jgi:uncharacterized protein YndB with AHSA1/START domain
MKWAIIVIGIVLAVFALVAVIGALVPRDHVAGASITVRQPPESVWKVVRDLGGVPSWWSEMKSSVRGSGSDGRERWSQEVNGFTLVGVVDADEPPRKLVTRIESAPGAPFGGNWTYEVAAVPGGSRVTVTERGWIGNPLFRFMARFIFGYYRSQEGYLRALGKRFGEDVMPERIRE